jgi:hypothetical protein
VFWGCAAAGAIGLVIGMRYRVSALVVATWLLLFGILGAAATGGFSAGWSYAAMLAPVLALQAGYGLGAFFAYGLSSRRPPQSLRDPHPGDRPTRRDRS